MISTSHLTEDEQELYRHVNYERRNTSLMPFERRNFNDIAVAMEKLSAARAVLTWMQWNENLSDEATDLVEKALGVKREPVEKKQPRVIIWGEVCAKVFIGPHGSLWGCTLEPEHEGKLHSFDNDVHPVVTGEEDV